jgi:hypothetical protein
VARCYQKHEASLATWSTLFSTKLKGTTTGVNGSSMTTLSPEVPATTLNAQPTIVDRDIHFPNLPPGVTAATLFTSACATMLAKLSGLSDVVFGRLMSARSNIPGALQSLVGPCINTLPVRVNFGNGATEDDVLATIQRQYLDGLLSTVCRTKQRAWRTLRHTARSGPVTCSMCDAPPNFRTLTSAGCWTRQLQQAG